MKRFNITGLCFPNEHYMADVSSKLKEVLDMVELGEYFIINRPRQYGKTTTLFIIADTLEKKGDYFVINISFEGVGDLFFSEEKRFTSGFISLLAEYAVYEDPKLAEWLLEEEKNVYDLKTLSQSITRFVEVAQKKVIVLIDEVDKSSNNQLFVSFLAMLRNKYLARGKAKTVAPFGYSTQKALRSEL